ncbi:MAG: GGDEF domain-containing protein [Spirochaetales bacterium]|nr:GGDEF domain-containing protein [Spirochaetales bacterium]
MDSSKSELLKSLREYLTDINISRVLLVGILYGSLEVVGLILSTLGFFESDIRLPVSMIVLFHLIYLPLLLLIHKDRLSLEVKYKSFIALIYFPVILLWGGYMNSQSYAAGGAVTVYTIALMVVSALIILSPRISIPFYLAGFVFFTILTYGTVENPKEANSLVFLGLIVTLIGFSISRENFRNRRDLFLSDQRLLMANIKLKDKTLRDSMTGLFNNAYMFEYLERVIEQKSPESKELAVLMLDLDHFKAINDTYGHAFGDKALKKTAEKMLMMTRESDLVGRYGGEEFLIILTNTTRDSAQLIAERLLKEISEVELGNGVSLSCSIGLAFHKRQTGEELIHQADLLMYKAKRKGRNRIEYED